MNNQVNIDIVTQEDLLESGCFSPKEVLEICKQAFIEYSDGNVLFPDKVSVIFDEAVQNRINCLPAGIISKNIFGMKWVSVFPNNPSNFGISNLTASIILSDLKTGYPIAFLEGSMCSNLRTAGISTLAATYLAKKNPVSIGFIGAGEQAKTHFLCMKSAFPSIKFCNVASRTKETEQRFVEQMEKFYNDVSYKQCDSDYKKAVEDVDIIVTAISGQEKILQADWVSKGTFYCHVAGLEDDFSVALKADKIVCDNWESVKHRTQTISRMYKLGLLKDEDIYANLDEIITNKKLPRENDSEFIYFNSVGMSFVDIYLANWMYSKVKKAEKNKNICLKKDSMFKSYKSFIYE